MANFNIDYLVVGAGGGGGSANGASGSGGGAGEYLYKTGQTISTGTAYTVDVGINGVGGATPGNGQNGTSGVDSSFNNYIARGGGFGVTPNLPGNGGDGGSGGGANYPTNSPGSSTAVSPGLGNSGGAGNTVNGGAGAYGSGGGGGAAQAGFPGTTSVAGNGGDGIYNSITGTSTAYAAGGGGGIFAPSGQYTFGIGGSGGTGGSSSITNNASDGAPSTGSGGGGGSYSTSTVPYNGGNGAQGIVILRWLTTDAGYTVSGANPTQTIDGAYTVLSFTAVVTSTITFNSTAITKMSSALVDFNSGTEDGLKLPSGDDANQPTGVQGMIRNNTDSGMSFYNGTEWQYFEATSPFIYSSFAAWDVGNAISYGGTGNTLYNIVNNPNGFNFTKYGGVSYDSTNKSFNFNGATGSNGAYMRFSQNAMNIPNGYTVSMWVNFTAFPANTALYAYGYNPSLRQFLTSTQMRYYVQPGPAGAYTPYFNHGMTTGNWYNITMVFTTTTVKAYISQEGDSTATLKQTDTTNHGAYQNTNQLYFGCNVQNYNSSFNGQLRIMEIYDSQLSQTDIDSIVKRGSQS
jgi:hypothetical protein